MKWIRILIWTAAVGVTVMTGIRYYIDSSADSYIVSIENAPQADAILILGAFVDGSGDPSPILADRLEYGYQLYRAGKAPKILVSGDHGTFQYDEVNGMKEYLLKKGVPKEDIFLDHAGFSTYDSMYRAKEVFQIQKLLISTQFFHINRSIFIARNLGIDAYGYPSPDKDFYRMAYLNFRENWAKMKAFGDVKILRKTPRFLGEPIPIHGNGTSTHDQD